MANSNARVLKWSPAKRRTYPNGLISSFSIAYGTTIKRRLKLMEAGAELDQLDGHSNRVH